MVSMRISPAILLALFFLSRQTEELPSEESVKTCSKEFFVKKSREVDEAVARRQRLMKEAFDDMAWFVESDMKDDEQGFINRMETIVNHEKNFRASLLAIRDSIHHYQKQQRILRVNTPLATVFWDESKYVLDKIRDTIHESWWNMVRKLSPYIGNYINNQKSRNYILNVVNCLLMC